MPSRYFAYWFSLAIVLAATSPAYWVLFKQMSVSDHLSHFPITLGLIGFLAYQRFDFLPKANFGTSYYAICLMILAALLLSGAGLLQSGWLGVAGSIIAVWGLIDFIGGRSARSAMRPAWLMSWMLLPLPFGIDRSLIIAMQKLASKVASSWLDSQSIANLATGVVIRTAGEDYLLEEACSGINSLFAALSIAVFWVLHSRYRWIRSVIVCAAVVFWVLVANAVRVWAIVYFDIRLGMDLIEEPKHTLLGLLTFSAAMAFSASTVYLFSFFLPAPHASDDSGKLQSDDESPTSKISLFPRSLLLLGVIVFCGLSFGMFRSRETIAANTIADATLMPSIDLGIAPPQVMNWKLEDSQKDIRDASSNFGLVSFAWRYSNADLPVVISLDGPFDQWHDLGYCYGATGWQLRDSQNVDLATSPSIDSMRCVELNLYRGDDERGLVIFTSIDSTGEIVSPPAVYGSVLRNLVNRIGMNSDRPTMNGTPAKPPIFQIQLLAETGEQMSAEQRSSLDYLYDVVRRKVIAQIREGAQQ